MMTRNTVTLLIVLVALALQGSLAQAYSITVDGDPSEWVLSAPTITNQGRIARNTAGLGEYIWNDASGDARSDFASPDSRVDLTEFRVTADADYLYFLAKVQDLNQASGDGAPQIQIAIDRLPGGETWLGSSSDTQVSPAAAWEYLLITRLGSGNADLTVWEGGFTSQIQVGSVVASGETDAIEIAVPWDAIGGPATSFLRFTVGVLRSNTSDEAWNLNGASDFLDAITNYETVASELNTWQELSDGVLNYHFDIWFSNVSGSYEPYAPVLVNEIMPNPSDGDEGREWIELANLSGETILLEGYRIGDEETPSGGEGMFRFPSGITMLPNDLAVITEQASGVLNDYPGLSILAEWESSLENIPDLTLYTPWATGPMILGNSGDEVLLLDAHNTILDVVTFGSGGFVGTVATSVPAEGKSLERIFGAMDTDDCSLDFVVRDNPSPGEPYVLVAAGGSCENDGDCESGVCVEDICCLAACDSLCEVCAAGTGACEPRSCPDDGSLCTTESCNPATGQCESANVTCVSDDDLCTTDSCNPLLGCVYTPIVCESDDDLCTTDACNPGTGLCENNPVVCESDNDLCTTDACNPDTGLCTYTSITCEDDQNPCTINTCDPLLGCLYTPKVCESDDNPCTDDACDTQSGLCRYTEVVCPDDDNLCTTASCNPETGICDGSSVLCDDMDPCTTNTCEPDQGCVYDPLEEWATCPSQNGNAFACLDGSCVEIIDNDRCQDALTLPLNQETAVSLDGARLFWGGSQCLPEATQASADVFFAFSVLAGHNYNLRVTPVAGLELALGLASDCDPAACFTHALAAGGADERLNLEALQNEEWILRLSVTENTTISEDRDATLFLEVEDLPVDGDEDGDIDGDEDGDIDGDEDGDIDGDEDGDIDGDEDGDIDGDEDGDIDGDEDGDIDGDEDGDIDGDEDGDVTDDDDDTTDDDDDDVTDDDDDVTDDDDDVTDDDDDVTDDDDDDDDDDAEGDTPGITDDGGSGSGGGCTQSGSSWALLLLLGLAFARRARKTLSTAQR